ncbi:unnamed protein product, partial [Rotaria sp. Silwood1]
MIRMKVTFRLTQWILSLLCQQRKRNDLFIYVCTLKSCPRVNPLKNDAILKWNGTCHNHDPKLAENVQNILTELKIL